MKSYSEIDLVCPRCPAMNRPGATIIELDVGGRTATCGVCAHHGPAEDFQPDAPGRYRPLLRDLPIP